jgi:acetyltransferase
VLKSLVKGGVFPSPYSRRFGGIVYAINPNAKEVLGKKCYANISMVKGSVDLAVVCVPGAVVPQVAQECGRKGVKALVVVSAGFAELGPKGLLLQQQLVATCKKYGMRLLGPNCLGIINPHLHLNASFALCSPPAGPVAFITQSGALADSVIDWSVKEGYGFSAVVSLGNSSEVDAADLLDWLSKDENTKAVTIYLEGLQDGRKFTRAARKLKGKKQIIVLKGGRTSAGSSAASSHTGALAGDFRVFQGAMKQAGVLMAESVEELFDLATSVCEQPLLRKNSVAIVTNGGGAGVLCADYCAQYGLNLVPLKKSTIRKLDRTGVMHPAYSRRNPLDIIGDAKPERYDAAVRTLLAEPYISGLIVIQTVQTMTNPIQDAKVIARARKLFPKKPVVCAFLGGKYSHEGLRTLKLNGIPSFNDPRKAVQAMAALGGLL